MNIVTPYPTSIPINNVNVTTESARRDNQLREMIAKPSATEAGVSERGVGGEHEKSKQAQQQQQQGGAEVNLRGEEHQKIGERQGGQGEQNAEQEQKQKEKEQAEKQLAKTEKELQRLDQKEVSQLKSRDTEVRTHEQAHAAVGGRYAGSPTYEFKRGPDGRNYAVGGEVQIDSSPVPGDPQATIQKMQQVRAAALAPAEPSGQDRKVAASANQILSQARAEQIKEQAAEAKEATQPDEETSSEQAQATEQSQTATQAQAAQPPGQSQQPPGIEVAQAAQSAQAADPFSILFGDQDDKPGRGSESVGQIFGNAGAPGGERRDEVNANRAAAEQRNADVVARAGRIESFYARSTVPSEGGFSQFA